LLFASLPGLGCSTNPPKPAAAMMPIVAGSGGVTSPAGGSAAAAGAGGAGTGSSATPVAGSGGAGAQSTPMAMPDGGPATMSDGAIDGGAVAPGSDAGPDPVSEPILPPATSVEQDGVFETTQDLSAGPRGQSGLFFPTELGRDGLAHPIFVWGCGGGSRPSSYAMHLNRIASHGFVVIAEVSSIGDDGAPLTAAIDWLIAENARAASMFFGKLDAKRIAAGGHSIGSVNTFLMADDPRLLTTVHVAGGSLDDINDPSAPTTGMGGKRLIHPVAYICSQSDLFGNVEKTEKDYAATTVPAFITIMTGSDHVAAAADGLPAMVAWLRWHLGGETSRKRDFLAAGGAFTSGKYVSRNKNW
jgi:hypothetical protein